MEFSSLLSIASFFIAAIALILNFRKDVHHVRLEVVDIEYGSKVLGINNDSSVPFGVLSIGCFDSSGGITWIERVSDYSANQYAKYPIKVEPRSQRSILLLSRNLPHENRLHGYCVQLETGRLYVLQNSAPTSVWLRWQFASLASRLSRGAWTPSIRNQPRLPSRLDD